MRILDRYVARQFIILFLLFVTGAPILFVIGGLVENMDKYMERGLTLSQIAVAYAYQFPQFVLFSVPIAALIATIFTVNGMTRHSEVVAAKAGGISFYRLLAVLPILGIVLTGAALALTELVPVTNRLYAEAVGDRQRQRVSRTDFVYRGQEGHVLAIRRLDMEQQRIVGGVSVQREGNEPETPSLYLAAREAVYDESSGWTFLNGHLRLLAGAGVERNFRFDELRPRWLMETPEQLLAEPKNPDEMRYAEIARFIEIIERSGRRPLELQVQKAQKIALPVATLVIILFAAPLATSNRRGGAAYGIGIALGITLAYLMLFRIAGAAGSSGSLDPMLAAWLPNLVFLVAALGMMTRVRS